MTTPIQTPKPEAKGLAIAALAVGIVAFLMGLVPVAGAVIAIAGIALGIVALVKKQPKGFALTGLILAAVAFLSSIVWTLGLGALFIAGSSEIESSPESALIEETPEPEEPAPFVPDLSTFSELDERTLALMAKDPAAYEGTNAIVYGEIVQYDSFTGKCGMRLNLGHTVMEYSFDYEHNTIATSGDGDANCPVLDPLVQGDIVKLWVTVLGAYDYDTTIGGTATSIAVEVWQAELLPNPEY